MPEAKVWSPKMPNLYRCRVTAKDSDAKDVLMGAAASALSTADKIYRRGCFCSTAGRSTCAARTFKA